MVSHEAERYILLFCFGKQASVLQSHTTQQSTVFSEYRTHTSSSPFQVFLQVIGVIAVAGVIIPGILIPVVPLLAVFLFLRHYFLQTSRDIKRLESTSNF